MSVFFLFFFCSVPLSLMCLCTDYMLRPPSVFLACSFCCFCGRQVRVSCLFFFPDPMLVFCATLEGLKKANLRIYSASVRFLNHFRRSMFPHIKAMLIISRLWSLCLKINPANEHININWMSPAVSFLFWGKCWPRCRF